MKHWIPIFLLLAPATAAADEYCDELWFTRNLMFDRAGYCFGSALGQGMFDNSDCIGKNVTLDPVSQRKVNLIREIEAREGCRVDTGQSRISFEDIGLKRGLTDLPVPDNLGSGCLGWRGGPVPLRAGHSAGAPPVGRLESGDYILFDHYDEGDWSFVTVYAPTAGGGWGPTKAMGWISVPMNEDSCDNWAG